MNILILNKQKAERLSYTDFSADKVIISIRTPNDKKANINTNNSTIKDILYLSFYDISYDTQSIFKDYPAMTDDDVIKIRDFVLKWKDNVSTFWVHCDIGMSRSAGVTAGIIKGLGGNANDILNSKLYYPNMLCYDKIVNVFNNKQ
jgi:predicted protein tyrosine phosphatase